MKKALLLMLALVMGFGLAAQNYGKLTQGMQQELEKRTAPDEQFRIIIGMAEKYDQAKLSKQIEVMKSEQRREFVINELSRFSATTQADLLQTLNEGQRADIVKDVQSFWIFNGVSCVTTREMIYTLSERPDIAYIESDELRNMLPEASLEMKKQNFKVENPKIKQTNRDGAKSIAWNVTQVHADQVWSQYNINGSGVVVAVIDTGVDYYHPDIADHMWDGGTEYPNHGWDFAGANGSTPDNDPIDDNSHGSHCAGTVAGNGTSGIQTGMAPGTTIMALKVLSAGGSGSTSNITSAMQFAVDHGADAVSMSLGGHGLFGNSALSLSYTERDMMVTLLNAGVVALVAAGNEGEIYNMYHEQASDLLGLGLTGTHYSVPFNIGNPGNCPAPWHNPEQTVFGTKEQGTNGKGLSACITIGASNRNDRKATFSSFGPCTWSAQTALGSNGYDDYEYDTTGIGLIKPDIIVPGTDITSMYYKYGNSAYNTIVNEVSTPNDTAYIAECGTSMATPGAAGITALIIQAYNAKKGVKPTPAQIDSILEVTALPVDFRDVKNNTTGAGRADAKAAVDAIYTTATKPTGFQITNLTDGVVNNGGCVHLSWTASTAPKGYAIYRDNEQVGTTLATTYTDKNPGAGKHTYYVRAIDGANIQSVRSKAAFCTVQPYAFADNANIIWNDETKTATLGWTPTLSNSATTGDLKYININNTISAFGGQGGTTVYWGMCFNPEDLREYQGMSITTIDLGIYKTSAMGIADDDVYLNIYRGTTFGNTTGTPVYREKFSIPQSEEGWAFKTLTLSTPYAITDITEDLWITFSDYITSTALGSIQEYPMTIGPYNGHNSNVFYMGSTKRTVNPENDLVWSHIPDFGDTYNYAVSFEAHLERTTTYTDSYTLTNPDNTTSTITEISGNYTTQVTPTLASGENTYKVTAKVSTGGTVVNTSCPEELKIVKVDSDRAIANVNIDQTYVYLVKDSSTLTIGNSILTLEPDAETRLIIDDGSQLKTPANITPRGTMKKSISGYNDPTGKDNYYLIASPIDHMNPASVTNMIPSAPANYDLYYFDQTQEFEEWQNYKDASFNLDARTGYLYANKNDVELQFAGTLNNTTQQYQDLVCDGTHLMSGWNLIGNPYSYEIFIDQDYFYRINEDSYSEVKPLIAYRGTYEGATRANAIMPLEGVFVKVTAANQRVNFSNEAVGSTTPGAKTLSLELSQAVVNRGGNQNCLLDRAYVNIGEGTTLPKLTLSDEVTKLYIPQGDHDYAVANSDGEAAVPVNFQANKNGTYTLSFNAESLEMDYLHLIDHITGMDIDLLQTPSYTFDANIDDYASRFKLVFNNAAATDSDLIAYVRGKEIVIMGTIDDNETVQLLDAMGHVLVSGIGTRTISAANLATGVYVVRLLGENDVKTQKVVIR